MRLQRIAGRGCARKCFALDVVVAQEFSCSWGLMVPYVSLILAKCNIHSMDVYVYVYMCATMHRISLMQSVLVS
jgi:hypothetical protein